MGETPQEKFFRRPYGQKLVSFADPNAICVGISWAQFINLSMRCGYKEQKFGRYAKFVQHYGNQHFGLFARKIIQDLDQAPTENFERQLKVLNEFFRADLRIEREPLTHAEMYNSVKELDLSTYNFDVDAMIHVGNKLYGAEVLSTR